MLGVLVRANEEDDEAVLDEGFIEFIELAEQEPKFFRKTFKQIYEATVIITSKEDFCKPAIRQQPIEFYVTMIERLPNLVKKDEDLLQKILETIFQLMLSIDATIEDSWLNPPEGYKESGDVEEDFVDFGKGCIDKIVSAVGDEVCLPKLSQAVQNLMGNDTDWRYKNAALMAFSQVGEYIDDIKKIGAMMPTVLQHLQHPNARVRYAALHCIGQISDDMTEDFQEEYGQQVLPELVKVL